MSWTTHSISCSSFVSHGTSEKIHYGAENVSEIHNEGHVILNGTKVAGSVFTRGNLTAYDANVGLGMRAHGNATLKSTTCKSEIVAEGSITATESNALSLDSRIEITAIECNISGKVSSRHSVTASRCPNLGRVTARGYVDLRECPSIESVYTEAGCTLVNSRVKEDVFIETGSGDITISHSQIDATLNYFSEHLLIVGGKISTIIVRGEEPDSDEEDENVSGYSDSGVYNVSTSGKYSHAIGRVGKTLPNDGVYHVSTTGKGSAAIGSVSGHKAIGINYGLSPQSTFHGGVTFTKHGMHLSPGATITMPQASKRPQKAIPKPVLVLRDCNVQHVRFEGYEGIVRLEGTSLQPEIRQPLFAEKISHPAAAKRQQEQRADKSSERKSSVKEDAVGPGDF